MLTLIESKNSYINFRHTYFKAKKAISNKEGHYIMIKGSNLQEHIPILNTYNNQASNYVRQKLIELQGKTEESIIIIKISIYLYQKWTDPVSREPVQT